MFYQKNLEKVLRFGDVVKGYISVNTTIKKPILSIPQEEEDSYKIDIDIPKYSAILTPCCSIGEGKISLCPLGKIKGDYLKNPYFAEDLKIINTKMEPQQALPPGKWEKLSKKEKEERLEEGKEYALLNIFIYDKYELFEEYTLRKQQIKYYMIDFEKAYTINCKMITRPEKSKSENAIILESKVLQLTPETRSELREKIANYYVRIPPEDKILED